MVLITCDRKLYNEFNICWIRFKTVFQSKAVSPVYKQRKRRFSDLAWNAGESSRFSEDCSLPGCWDRSRSFTCVCSDNANKYGRIVCFEPGRLSDSPLHPLSWRLARYFTGPVVLNHLLLLVNLSPSHSPTPPPPTTNLICMHLWRQRTLYPADQGLSGWGLGPQHRFQYVSPPSLGSCGLIQNVEEYE